MSGLDNFEKRFLFGLTRAVAMFIIVAIFITLVLGGIFFISKYEEVNSKVSAAEIVNIVKPPVAAPQSASALSLQTKKREDNSLPAIKTPFVLQKNLNTPEKIKVVKDWLDDVPLDKEQEFIDEMAAAVTEAEKLNLSATETMDTYKVTKFKRLALEKEVKAERDRDRLYMIGATLAAVALVALFSLILVLLAIERNTRRTEQ
jgi:hypothetical protein